jgi:hypothetical protein
MFSIDLSQSLAPPPQARPASSWLPRGWPHSCPPPAFLFWISKPGPHFIPNKPLTLVNLAQLRGCCLYFEINNLPMSLFTCSSAQHPRVQEGKEQCSRRSLRPMTEDFRSTPCPTPTTFLKRAISSFLLVRKEARG